MGDKQIIKGIGGFYYVKTADAVLEAKAKGIFRKIGMTPLAGDYVELEQSNGDYVISEIHERKNSFLRPAAANIDVFFLVVSTTDPAPNLLVLDKLLAIAEEKAVMPVILLTKGDILPDLPFAALYRNAGFRVIDVREDFEAAKREILKMMEGRLSLFAGNSGVGKTTLLNDFFGYSLATAETSKKLGRGRHTTRAVEIFEAGNGYVADSPGFSAVDIERAEYIPKEELQNLFIDISPYVSECQFRGCSHRTEKGCAVIEAVENGAIQRSRYSSYRELYERASKISEWEQR